MSKFALRRLPKAQAAWHPVLAGWRARGVAAGLGFPPSLGPLIRVNADDGEWQALLDPREWLAQTAPELAAMAASACDDRQIMALFNAMPRPLTFADGALDYRRLQAQESLAPIEGRDAPMPRVSARECALWIKAIAPRRAMPPMQGGHRLRGVPLTLAFILGVSRLPAAIAGEVAVGDIVLITTRTRRVTCQGKRMGHFCQQEEMIMIDENHEEVQDEGHEGGYDEYRQPMDDHQPSMDSAPLPEAMAALPLNVEFILQRRFLSIGEVQAFFAGKVLGLDPACEQNIELRSNGHLLARGELVQLEDRLGVEIMELYPDDSHA